MTKTLNGQNSYKQNFKLATTLPLPPFSTFQYFNAIWNTLLQLLLVLLFTDSLLHFKLIKFLLPQSTCDCIAYKLIKYRQFQISEIKLDKTPYAVLYTIILKK